MNRVALPKWSILLHPEHVTAMPSPRQRIPVLVVLVNEPRENGLVESSLHPVHPWDQFGVVSALDAPHEEQSAVHDVVVLDFLSVAGVAVAS